MFLSDVSGNFKKQLDNLKHNKNHCKIDYNDIDNNLIINYIIKYIELLEQDKFDILKKYIDERKIKLQEQKEQIECKKHYCSFWNYYELIQVVYRKYNSTRNKQKFIQNLWNFIDKKLIKYIHINNQYLLVEQFYKIYSNQIDIDYDILENRANSILSRMWWKWNNKYIFDYIWQTIVELKDKINLEDWQNNYKSIYSYIYSYFKLSIAKVSKLNKIVDIPIDVLSCQYSNKEYNDKNNTESYKYKEKRFNNIFNRQTNSFNISSLDKIDSFMDLTWNAIDSVWIETKYYIDFLEQCYKEQKYWFILQKYYIEWYWLKEIWDMMWISAERVRQKKNKALEISKKISWK